MAKKTKDAVSLKHLNPVKYVTDVNKTIKKSPIQGITTLLAPALGRGMMPDVVNAKIGSKGKYEYQGGEVYDTKSSLVPMATPNPAAPAPEAPTAEAPIAQRGRTVQESQRQAKIDASKRKGLLSTILAANKDAGNKLGGAANILG